MIGKYNTQGKCIAYLEKKRWSDMPICPYCGSNRSSKKTQELRHTCLSCGRSFSVLVGTIFEATKLPINKWFTAICLILHAKKGISSLQLARNLHVNKNDYHVFKEYSHLLCYGVQNSPPHPFLVTLELSRFQAEFIINSKYLSSSILMETLL